MISLRKKEVLSTGLSGLSLIALGVANSFNENKILSISLLIFIICSYVLSKRYLKKAQSDTWDELANEHHNIAESLTSSIINLIFALLLLSFIIFDYEITINYSNLAIFCGSTIIFRVLIFVLLESSNS